ANLTNLADFEQANNQAFSEAQIAALTDQHFFIQENTDIFYNTDPDDYTSRYDDWSALYNKIRGGSIYDRAPEDSVFITSDYLLHIYYKLVSKQLEYLEETKLYPDLTTLTDYLFAKSLENYQNSSDPANQESFARLTAYFAVPKAILTAVKQDSEIDQSIGAVVLDNDSDSYEQVKAQLVLLEDQLRPDMYQLALEELDLLMQAEIAQASPLFGDLINQADLEYLTDYSQFQPRSHYNRNPILRSYFRAMTWYGQNNFFLQSKDLTRDAINMSLLFAETGGEQMFTLWSDMGQVIAFLVGPRDDLSLGEYLISLKNNSTDNQIKVNEQFIEQVQASLATVDGPQIMSSLVYGDEIFSLTKDELQENTKGFRLMAPRFTPDAFIFSTLTQGDELVDEKTGEKLPSNTTPLLVMSIFGNNLAKDLSQNWIENNAPQSKNVLADRLNTLDQLFSNKTEKEWTNNFYWSWLYTLKALFKDYSGDDYPMFMQKPAWQNKNLQTALGSWTELKHATLLYAKQSYAEMGDSGDERAIPPVPKGYVEPDIEFLDRLLALSKMTLNGLSQKGLMDDIFLGRHETFIEALEFFREIAVKQLANQTISDEDFEKLRTISDSFVWSVLQPLPGEEYTEDHVRSAIVADVHTDGLRQKILYVANGIPNYIYVAVSDANGTRLTKGLTYSYYEFEGDLGKRLTDQDWRELNYTQDKSQLPNMPDWNADLIK
ncbi:MAG TPA: DUF3160 domain-containing protein, partial [Candidatus Woesebacteria bacterium]|nr:DUF3160 domain-containing protein [Candidatus Woesebacteria bacterium]